MTGWRDKARLRPRELAEVASVSLRTVRWWNGCRIHRACGEVLIEPARRSHRWMKESVERLASLGVRARVVHRPPPVPVTW